jgi:hypothetical protein
MSPTKSYDEDGLTSRGAPTGISASISFQHPFNRAGRRTSNVVLDGQPIHVSKSAIAALTLPLIPSAIWRVMVMGAPQRRARKAAWVNAETLKR